MTIAPADCFRPIANDLLKLSERYRIGRLFWLILSTIGLSDFHTIVLTLINTRQN